MPNPLSITPTLDEIISWALDTRLGQMFFALPGIIRSYNAADQVADIQPLIRHNLPLANGTEFSKDPPLLRDVPVIFPRGGSYFLSFPLKVDDKVLLVFCDRNIDQYIRSDNVSNAVVDPFDLEVCGLNGAVAIPGFYPLHKKLSATDASASNMVLGKEGGTPQIHFDSSLIRLGSSGASDPAAKSSVTNSRLDALESKMNAVIALYNAHVHPHPLGPTSSTASAATTLTPGSSTAATKVMVE